MLTNPEPFDQTQDKLPRGIPMKKELGKEEGLTPLGLTDHLFQSQSFPVL